MSNTGNSRSNNDLTALTVSLNQWHKDTYGYAGKQASAAVADRDARQAECAASGQRRAAA